MDNIDRKEIEINLGRQGNLLILLIFALSFLTVGLLNDNPANIINGLLRIIISRDILLTDYLAIGGLGPTFINAAIIAILNILILHKLKLKINGTIIAAIFTLTGFSFLGKNIYNVWPMYLGGLLYIKFRKIDFRSILVIIMFSTSIAPIVSEVSFSMKLPLYYGIPLGVLFGVICGFLITPLSVHLSEVHGGYILYNIGFTAGVMGTILNSLLKSFNINIESQQILSSEYDIFLKIFLFIIFIFLIALGFIINQKSFKGYSKIFSYSGRLVTDFTQHLGFGLTYINMGVMGLVSMLYVIMINGTFNGPITGCILTVVGFSALGNHPKNSIPILIGISLAAFIKIWDINSTLVIISALFGTTLAPIAGKYGFLAGIIAGFIHLSVSMNVGIIHGGINLYNNGFSGGLVAAVLVPILEAFKKGD